MAEIDLRNTFRGFPLTEEQDAEVRHYIKKKNQNGDPWDTPELADMIKDMLVPPISAEETLSSIVSVENEVVERAAASVDEAMEPIEANEELHAAIELEMMKGP